MNNQKPERTETVCINMVVKGSAYDKHKKAIHILTPNYGRYTDIQLNDTICIHYKFWASYYDVVQKLQSVQDICDDPDVVVTVDCSELEAGRILVYETLKKLDSIIQQVKDRK